MNSLQIICILAISLILFFIDMYTFFSPIFSQTMLLTCIWNVTLSKKSYINIISITPLLLLYSLCCHQTYSPVCFALIPTSIIWYLFSQLWYDSWAQPYVLTTIYSLFYFKNTLSIDILPYFAKFTIIHFFAILIISKIYEKYQAIA